MTTKTDYFPLGGGLDLSTPALSVKPGTLLDCINFTPDISGGYRLTGLYERFDGQPAPSDAEYYLLEVADESSYSAGDSLLGGSSGATATVIATAPASLVITQLTGSFTPAESIGATTVTTAEEIDGEEDLVVELEYRRQAQDHYRTPIAAVPGSGPVRGVWRHKAKTYAFRDNAGGTAVDVYKASAAGWTQITLSTHTVRYDAGSIAFAEGDTVTGLSSSATGTVHRVVVHGGSIVGTDEYGYLVLTSVTGTFTDNEALQVSAATNATADGASSAFSLLPGGRFDFRSHNFLATASTYYVYGCDGVNPAFEIDDSDLITPILMSTLAGVPASNAPHLIEVHKGHVFLAFPNGIVQHSTPTDALSFSGVLSASEFGLSEEITSMLSVAGGVLMLFTRRQTWGLYGTNVSDWTMNSLSDNTGSLLYGAVPIGRVYAWDDRGVIRMDRVQAFGDFQSAAVSRSIQKVLAANTQYLIASVVYKARDQFWMVLSTGDVIVAYVSEQGRVAYGWITLGFTPGCASNAPDEQGDERIFFGDDAGFVYEMNKGMAQDGAAMEFGFRTTYNHMGSPRIRKSFKHLQVEIETPGIAMFDIATEYDYSAAFAANNIGIGGQASGGGGFWNTALWNNFIWGAQDIPTSELSITGTGMNISIGVYGESDTLDAFTLQGFMIHYIPRRINRG